MSDRCPIRPLTLNANGGQFGSDERHLRAACERAEQIWRWHMLRETRRRHGLDEDGPELERGENNAQARRWQEVRTLREAGYSTAEIAAVRGCHPSNVRQIVQRMKEAGAL